MFAVYESDGTILDLKTSTSALLAQKCLDNRTCHGRIFVLLCLAQDGEMNYLSVLSTLQNWQNFDEMSSIIKGGFS